jgi:hypothetical protein
MNAFRISRQLKWYWARLNVMSPREVLHRAADAARLLRLVSVHFLYRWGLSGVAKDAEANWDFPSPAFSAIQLQDRVRYLRGELPMPHCNWKWRDENTVWIEARDTRKCWPQKFFALVDFRPGNATGDARTVWEASRLQQLVVLAQIADSPMNQQEASRALEMLKTQLLHWIAHNPPYKGIHYVSSMECGLRVIAVAISLAVARNRHKVDPRVLSVAHEMIHYHAILIENRLSLFSSYGNHTIAEAVGLYFAAEILGGVQSTARRARSLSIIRSGLDRLVLSDGGGGEQSIGYLLSVLDLLIVLRNLLEHRRAPCPNEISESIRKGCQFVRALGDCVDAMPHIGDCDSGFSISRYHAGIWKEPHVSSEINTFPISGYTTYQSLNSTGIRWVFDHGGLGLSPSYGHGHADALNFLLAVDGGPMLVDSGTYVYGGPGMSWRSHFRGTASHNTVTVNGLDQSVQQGSFLWESPFSAKLVYTELENSWGLVLLGSHDAYRQLKITHYRGIYWDTEAQRGFVWDFLTGHDQTVEFALNWHVGGDGMRVACGQFSWLTRKKREFSMRVRHLGDSGPECGIKKDRAWASSLYGHKRRIDLITTTISSNKPVEVLTEIKTSGDYVGSVILENVLREFRSRV